MTPSSMPRPNIESMTLRELADWVAKNNNGLFDTGEFPSIDDLTDEEESSAREEYEAMAEEILTQQTQGVNMKIKTNTLTDAALDRAVAKAWQSVSPAAHLLTTHAKGGFRPSTDWAQGGPIIEREKITLEYMAGAGDGGLDVWMATRIEGSCVSEEQGPTPLIAAMRCFVASCLGDEIEVPEGLK